MKWIPVSEPPETSGKYLTMSSDYHKVGHGWYNTKYNPGWEDDKENYLPVTHWMPLPPTPEETPSYIQEQKSKLYKMKFIKAIERLPNDEWAKFCKIGT